MRSQPRIKTKIQALADVKEVLKIILQNEEVSTQEDIKQALQHQGFIVNQSKVSRLLRKIGASKTTNEQGQIIYSLPREPAPLAAKNILSELVLEIAANESLIIIRTNPGSASLVARLLDHQQAIGVIGTIAGDDTIFVAPQSVKQIEKIKIAIKNLLMTH